MECKKKSYVELCKLSDSYIFVQHRKEGKYLYDLHGKKILDYPVESFGAIDVMELGYLDYERFSSMIEQFHWTISDLASSGHNMIWFKKDGKKGLLLLNSKEESNDVFLDPEFEEILLYPYDGFTFVAKCYNSESWKAMNVYGEILYIPSPLTTSYKDIVSLLDSEFYELYLCDSDKNS